MVCTIYLTALAYSWYSGDGDDDKKKKKKKKRPYDFGRAMKSLFYTSMLASISERFPQMGGIPFVAAGSDIIKSATVGTVILDDAHFILDAGKNLLDFLSTEVVGNDDDNTELINGSFSGKTKKQKNITRAAALLDIDTAPWLLALDALEGSGVGTFGIKDAIVGKSDERAIDYNLNLFKSITEQGNIGRAKWYQDLIPTEWIYKWWNEEFPNFPLTKPKPDKNKSKPKKTVSYESAYM